MHQFLRFGTSRITNVQNSTDAEHHSRCPNIRSWYRQHQDRPNICLWYPPRKFHGAGHIVLKALEYSMRLIKQLQKIVYRMWRAKTYICQKSSRIYLAFLWDQLTISRTWRRHRISVKSVCSDPQNCERKQYKRKYMGEWAKTHKRPTIYASIPTLWNIAYNQCAKQYRCWAPFTLSEHTQLVSPTTGPAHICLWYPPQKFHRAGYSVKGIGIFYNTLNKAIAIDFVQDVKSKNIFAKNHREFI